MSASASLHSRIDLYLAERSRLGFACRHDANTLRSLARHVQSVRHNGPLTVEVMADWARHDSHCSSDPHTWARRLKGLRTFMRWLQQFEPRTEVPNDAIFGRLPERQAPRALVVRLRHPEGKPLRAVAVNGQAWRDFDPARECVRIEKPAGRVKIEAAF